MREKHTQAEGEVGSTQGARRGTQSRDSRITLWAEGRCQTAEPPGDPSVCVFLKDFVYLFERERLRASMSEGQRQREKEAPCSAGSWMQGPTPGPWDHDLSQRQRLNWLSHPSSLTGFLLIKKNVPKCKLSSRNCYTLFFFIFFLFLVYSM